MIYKVSFEKTIEYELDIPDKEDPHAYIDKWLESGDTGELESWFDDQPIVMTCFSTE